MYVAAEAALRVQSQDSLSGFGGDGASPHLTAAARKAFASLCYHPSNELHSRKQLPRQP